VACSNGYGVPQTPSISTDSSAPKASVAPVELRSSAILAKIHAADRRDQADAVTPGIYVDFFGLDSTTIYGYPDPDKSNGPPVCSVGPIATDYANIAVDRQGDLIVLYDDNIITVFAGPGLCGPELGSINDPYFGVVFGNSIASRNVQGPSGRIVVGSGVPKRERGHGGVSVCTLSGGCAPPIGRKYVNTVVSVALAPNGDCWASGYNELSFDGLVYFAHCRGPAVPVTGATGDGNLDIDANGNLVQGPAPEEGGGLTIYSGCNPACKLVGGPFSFQENGTFEKLDASSKHFIVAAGTFSQPKLDVYAYSTTGIKYEYSISKGLSPSDVVSGAAFSPGSKE
jgi:hypothetical protein